MTTTTHASTYQWLVMHDDPDAEGWIGEFTDTNTLSFDEYMEVLRTAQQPGVMITIDPEWLQPETTPTPDPSTLDSLDISDAAVWELFETTRDTGVLLRVTPVGSTHGNQMKVIVDAVHDLVDVHALPGSPERRLLDFFGRGTPTEPDPLNALWQRPQAELDGFGDDAHRHRSEHVVTEYERQGEIAHARCAELGMESDWSIDCIFPEEMLYASLRTRPLDRPVDT